MSAKPAATTGGGSPGGGTTSGSGTAAGAAARKAPPETLLDDWLETVQVLHVAHGIAAERAARLSRVVGVVIAVLAASVGTALFVTPLGSSEDTLRRTIAALSVAAALLGVLQVVLNAPEVALRHRQAFVDFGLLRREMEMLREGLGASARVPAEPARAVRESWSRIEQSAPGVSRLLRARARRELRAAQERRDERAA